MHFGLQIFFQRNEQQSCERLGTEDSFENSQHLCPSNAHKTVTRTQNCQLRTLGRVSSLKPISPLTLLKSWSDCLVKQSQRAF